MSHGKGICWIIINILWSVFRRHWIWCKEWMFLASFFPQYFLVEPPPQWSQVTIKNGMLVVILYHYIKALHDLGTTYSKDHLLLYVPMQELCSSQQGLLSVSHPLVKHIFGSHCAQAFSVARETPNTWFSSESAPQNCSREFLRQTELGQRGNPCCWWGIRCF